MLFKGKVLQIDDRQAIVGIEDSGVEGVVPANQLSSKPVEDINTVCEGRRRTGPGCHLQD